MKRRRVSRRVRRNRIVAGVVAAILVGVAVALSSSGGPEHTVAPKKATTDTRSSANAPLFASPGTGTAHLAPGSDPSVLPGPVLIADEGNNRLLVVDAHGRTIWTFPQPGDLASGVEFRSPDDAFFTPDGKQIIATEEEYSVVTLIDVATRKILWRYGTPAVPGNGPNQLSNPDDAVVLPNGDVLTADIKNCRILLIAPHTQVPARVYGTTTPACRHAPPVRFGSPNGVFPMVNGHYLVTEINGDWVDEIDLGGRIYGSWHPPGVGYPSDSNEVRPGTYLTVDYSNPGQIETFNASGRLLWRYRPTGSSALNHPSLAFPLPNGDVIATDDANDRIIVVDPKTNTVVWQYGIRGQPGDTPGLLNAVDGLDLVPPHSELVVHAKTMGLPPSSSAAKSTAARS
jgi:outer membrane protein assembly factor BamB